MKRKKNVAPPSVGVDEYFIMRSIVFMWTALVWVWTNFNEFGDGLRPSIRPVSESNQIKWGERHRLLHRSRRMVEIVANGNTSEEEEEEEEEGDKWPCTGQCDNLLPLEQ